MGPEPVCDDGRNNDFDGNIDLVDADCALPKTICNDGLDNDLDTLVDCLDPDCSGSGYCPLLDPGEPCSDNIQCLSGKCAGNTCK